MAFFNTNLHNKIFEQRLPVYPESKRRTKAEVEIQRQLPLQVPTKGFNLYAEAHTKKTHDYILGNSTAKTFVSHEFFSQENIDNIQKMIRFMVYDQTEHIIDRQTDDDLLIIMMSMYKQFSTFPVITDPVLQKETIRKEIDRLNLYVLRDAVPDIVSNVKAYFGYLRDASMIPAPIPRPLGTSNAGTKELRAVTDVLYSGPNTGGAYGFTQGNVFTGYP